MSNGHERKPSQPKMGDVEADELRTVDGGGTYYIDWGDAMASLLSSNTSLAKAKGVAIDKNGRLLGKGK
jgi:hypothetical protein